MQLLFFYGTFSIISQGVMDGSHVLLNVLPNIGFGLVGLNGTVGPWQGYVP